MNNLLSQYRRYLERGSYCSGKADSSDGSELQQSATPTNVGASSEPSVVEPSKPLSPSTIKNYLSDTRHFLSWLQKAIQEPEIKPEHITPAVVKAYGSELNSKVESSEPRKRSELNDVVSGASSEPRKRSELIDAGSVRPPLATTNRRLSSLRRFGQFLEASGLLDTDPTADLSNPNPATRFTTMGRILTQYQDFLKDEDLSNSTIKNYLSDLKSYLSWADKNTELLDSQQNQRLS